jgi:hypothetical protein
MSALTATGIAVEWMDRGFEPEVRLSDGTDIYRYAIIDLDYEMAYLLRATTGETCSWLAVYQRHAHIEGEANGLSVEWLYEGEAFPFFDQDPFDAMSRFVGWTESITQWPR